MEHLLPDPANLVFDLTTFERELRQRHAAVEHFDMDYPKANENVAVRVTYFDGTSETLTLSGLTLLAWGAFR